MLVKFNAKHGGDHAYAISEMRRLEGLMGPAAPHRLISVPAVAAAPNDCDDDDRASIATSCISDGWPKDVSRLEPTLANQMRTEYRKLYKQARNKSTAIATKVRCERRMAELLAEITAEVNLS
jgi:hypothetical protein